MNTNPLATVKEIVRISTTAGLSKDVIDLLEKKSALLAKQVEALEGENARLKIENAQLRARLNQPQPVVKLDDTYWKALIYFCDRDEVVTIQEIAGHLGCTESKARFVCDGLSEKGLISFANMSNVDPRWESLSDNSGFKITSSGRKERFEHED
jgi:regulator of replication initiation timing